MILKKYLDKNYTKEEQSNLTMLYCSFEDITSLEGIEQLVKLRRLYCSNNNRLTSLKGIEQLTELNYLDCSNNNLKSLKEIEKLVNLIQLECPNNNLISLKGIERLDKLIVLDCHNNPLPYSDLFNFSKIKLELKKEVRQDKIYKLLL